MVFVTPACVRTAIVEIVNAQLVLPALDTGFLDDVLPTGNLAGDEVTRLVTPRPRRVPALTAAPVTVIVSTIKSMRPDIRSVSGCIPPR